MKITSWDRGQGGQRKKGRLVREIYREVEQVEKNKA